MEKLDRLDRYSEIVTTAMRHNRAFPQGVTFIDLMAGPGVCVDTRSRPIREFDGSTLLALNNKFPFTRMLAIESNPANAAALRQRVARSNRSDICQVVTADCNSHEVITLARDAASGALALMFVDLLGTEVRMATIRAIALDRSVDLVVTWPEMDLVRNRGQMLEQAGRWDAFFGTDRWRAVASELGPGLRLRALQRIYADELRLVGYHHIEYVGGVRNSRGRVLYRPLFASKHPLGLNLWRKAAVRPLQGGLFEA